MRVEALRPKGPVERFHVRVIGRFARPREVDPHTILVCPQIHNVARKLGPIIAEQHLRRSPILPNPDQDFHDLFALQTLPHLNSQAFSREHIHHRQRPEARV